MLTRSRTRVQVGPEADVTRGNGMRAEKVHPVNGVPLQETVVAVSRLAKSVQVVNLSSSEDESEESEESEELTESTSDKPSSTSDGEKGFSEDDESYSDEDDEACNNVAQKKQVPSAIDKLLYKEIAKLVDGGDLTKLKVDHCKQYLRAHGLRLTGTKDVLLDRIKQHLEIVDGKQDTRYAPATFSINCKGDVCCGDVVMFTQKVYKKFDITTKSAAPIGKRVVAGRVVKESYGAQKQQHTFTVEVLWSTGVKVLPPMHPLLVKGRNLYRLKTWRQPWANEDERKEKLEEKHKRGASARSFRKEGKIYSRRKGMSKAIFEEMIGQKHQGNPYSAVPASKVEDFAYKRVRTTSEFRDPVCPSEPKGFQRPISEFYQQHGNSFEKVPAAVGVRPIPNVHFPVSLNMRTGHSFDGLQNRSAYPYPSFVVRDIPSQIGENKSIQGAGFQPLDCSGCVKKKGSRDCCLKLCYHCCKGKGFCGGQCKRHLFPPPRCATTGMKA